MDLSIIVISYNTRELTMACLRSIYQQTREIDFEVIVLDNDSKDGSAAAVAVQHPQVRLLTRETNVGFACGNNVAAKAARGEHLLLLNSDTVVLDGAVQRAIAFLRSHPGAGIVGGRTFFPDGSLNYSSCHDKPSPWSLFCLGVGLGSVFRRSRLFNPESLGPWRRDSIREVGAVTGCFLLIRRALWEQLGGFDESFFMYGEETDLCIRVRKLGLKCVIDPDVKLIHYGGASDRVRADKMARVFVAKAHLIRKHWSRRWQGFGIICLTLWPFTRLVAFTFLRHLRPQWEHSYSVWKSIWQRRVEWKAVGGFHRTAFLTQKSGISAG